MSATLRRPSAVCALALATLSAPPQAETPSHRLVRVAAHERGNPVEASVAIDPADPASIVAAGYRSGGPGEPPTTNSVYTSRDGGVTWQATDVPNRDRRSQGDDAVAFGPDGAVYHSYISFEGIRVPRPARAVSGIFVRASPDAGRSWLGPVPVVDHLNTVQPFEDKPWIEADRAPGSPNRGNVYVAWTRFDEYGSAAPDCRTHIYLSRSTDAARSFSAPMRVSDQPGGCLDDDHTVEGAMPAVGARGEVYVVWAGPRGLVMDRSDDGGVTFGADRMIGDMPGGWDLEIAGVTRSNGMPVTRVDHSAGARRGTVYVNWIDSRDGDPDVFVKSSSDGGATWSEPVRVNDDPKGTGAAQFFTWMAVDPGDGAINVVFYDRRGRDGTTTGLTLARSVDGGRTFVNHQIDQPPFATTAALRFGDYLGVDALNGFVVAMYPHFVTPAAIDLSAALFRFRPGTQSQ